MGTWVILASGPSLNDDDLDYVRQAYEEGRVEGVIAVSDVGLLKAPWASALASHDGKWWMAHPEHADFKGAKFCANNALGVKKFNHRPYSGLSGCNSGLYAMYVALKVYKATKIILLGFDLHAKNGAHFFGEHKAVWNKRQLKNSTDRDFIRHIRQFDRFQGCEVVNCTKGSALKRFPFAELRDIL